MRLVVPDPSLVVLVGPAGAGKSTLARRCFDPTEILSSDEMRARVSGDPADQAASADAFEVLHALAAKRLARNLLTVADATNVETPARQAWLRLAREHHVMPVAVVLALPLDECLRLNAARVGRVVPESVVREQHADMMGSLSRLDEEGFHHALVIESAADAAGATLAREPLACDRRDLAGPFDIVGDVHGCFAELVDLMGALGWQDLPAAGSRPARSPSHPGGRTFVFLGDLVDRGPGIVEALELARLMVEAGTALWVPGNHERKVVRHVRGKAVKVRHGLEQTLEQMGREPASFATDFAARVEGLPEHLVLDGGRLVVAHAGMREGLQGRWGGAVRSFAFYGQTTGETDEYGLPIRHPWAKEYHGSATVVYGHTPIPEPEWINDTICLDTGCVFGGKLTALRWPERDLVSVPARRVHYAPSRPFPGLSS